ncbi:vesicle-fusing ATPase [Sporormia fimetaria CBS 119925]|uniref:Vesicular-fusion protein SEC18 n=1 Tax=Sporormia fimetaria CBS 119925 TaxID=1340428 RepID=A0A6A6VBA8_9PLEO|nr:vesicle-fusing ATPase [Sporormia fimetaria CBS 119925]
MFNRDRLPGLPGSSPRPQRNEGYERVPRQESQPPQRPSGYDPRMGDPSPGYRQEPSAYRAPPPTRATPQGGGSLMLHPIKNPGGHRYVLSNLADVSEHDFGRGDFMVIVNDLYVFSARPTGSCEPGSIGLTDAQRTWAKVSLSPSPENRVKVERYDHSRQGDGACLGTVALEVAFASNKYFTDVPYDQDKLHNEIMKIFTGQVFAPGQQVLMDIENIMLRFTVKSVTLTSYGEKPSQQSSNPTTDVRVRGVLTPETQIDFFKDARSGIQLKASVKRAAPNSIVQPGFKFEDMGIGGLDTEFSAIFRRAFASRIFPPGLVEKLGIQHVRGILLYGPPGTGKTLIARQIGKMLNAREPKVINGPEVLNKYVGQSEENIRKLFAEAEKEYKEKGDESGLHIIIFDELDAVCKQRGTSGGGTGVGDSVVNQLLSKLDGVDQLNNILLIGMTNRMDMIDEALLRPGRLEVHMEISLPDEHGRAQILGIHTNQMRSNNVLDNDVNIEELAKLTKNFSGAEITGLVKAASSFAFNRHVKVGTLGVIEQGVENLKVKRQDFLSALDEVKPLFGVAEEELSMRFRGGVIKFSKSIDSILKEGRLYVNQVKDKNDRTPILSVLLHGPAGSGKTALAAKMAIDSEFPFIKLISPEDMVGYSDMQKIQKLDKTFRDAYKSPLSVIVIDGIEMLFDYVPVGPRFSTTVLSALKVLLEKAPPKGRRLLVFATTTDLTALANLDLYNRFDAEIAVGNVDTLQELEAVLQASDFPANELIPALREIQESTGRPRAGQVEVGVGIKQILTAINTANQDDDVKGRFAKIMSRQIAANRARVPRETSGSETAEPSRRRALEVPGPDGRDEYDFSQANRRDEYDFN